MTFCLRFYVILTMYVWKYLFTRSPIIFGGGQNSEQEVSNEIVNVKYVTSQNILYNVTEMK